MTNPVPGKRVTTPYGKPGRLWKTGYHVGSDYAAPTGTKIVAAKGGKVLEAKNGVSWGAAYGNAVVIDHGSGLRAIYAHMSKISVKAGQEVEEGQEIGLVGSTGNSTGPHLHLEVRVSPWRYNNKDVDPEALLSGAPRISAKDGKVATAAKTVAAKVPVVSKGKRLNQRLNTIDAKLKKAKKNGNAAKVEKLKERKKNVKEKLIKINKR